MFIWLIFGRVRNAANFSPSGSGDTWIRANIVRSCTPPRPAVNEHGVRVVKLP